MPKIRLTKNELKAQRENLKRFTRYLPTLQLKQRQLQLEVRRARERLQQCAQEEEAFWQGLGPWIALAGAPAAAAPAGTAPEVEAWRTGERNIAGIDIPTFESLQFAPATERDLFAGWPWEDDLQAAARALAELRLRQEILEQQAERLGQELRVTTQRVNLFEKVKIPEATDNIRVIRIYLGDQQTTAVGRAKIAKAKCQAQEEALRLHEA
jgi:V/A-type H+-transporting ATPase subunit D